MEKKEKLIDISDMAEILGVSSGSIRNWIKWGRNIPYYKPGSNYLFDKEEVMAWAKNEGSGKQ